MLDFGKILESEKRELGVKFSWGGQVRIFWEGDIWHDKMARRR